MAGPCHRNWCSSDPFRPPNTSLWESARCWALCCYFLFERLASVVWYLTIAEEFVPDEKWERCRFQPEGGRTPFIYKGWL